MQMEWRAVQEQAGPVPALRSRFRLDDPARWSVGWQQAVFMTALILFVAVVARLGAAALANAIFVAAGVMAAIWYKRVSPWQYVLLTFWFWTLTPLARRLVDYYSAFNPTNPILGAPNLMALLMLKDILTSRDLPRLRETLVGLFLLLPVLWGLCMSLVKGDVMPGVVASADWIVPLLYYFYFIANWRHIGEFDRLFRDFLCVNGLIVIGYGLIQYFSPSPWDVTWVIYSGLTNVGSPVPYGLKAFSTLNAPGPLALWLGTFLLLLIHFRTRLSLLLALAGTLLLLTTLVRSVTGTVVVGLLMAALMGRSEVFKILLVGSLGLLLLGAVTSAVDPPILDSLALRFGTLNNLQEDDSALTRAAIYRETPAIINAHPLGLGIGALGRGAVASRNADLVSVDSGPLAIYLALGWVAGTIYLAGIVLALIQAVLAAKVSRAPAAMVLAVAAVAGSCNMIFVNMSGFWGVTIWSCVAYATALGIAQPAPARIFLYRN